MEMEICSLVFELLEQFWNCVIWIWESRGWVEKRKTGRDFGLDGKKLSARKVRVQMCWAADIASVEGRWRGGWEGSGLGGKEVICVGLGAKFSP